MRSALDTQHAPPGPSLRSRTRQTVPVALTHSYLDVVPKHILDRYDFAETHSAAAVLSATSPDEFADLLHVLENFWLTMPKVAQAGGNKSVIAAELDEAFRVRGWREARYEQDIETRLIIEPWKPAGETDQSIRSAQEQTTGHKVDNVKGRAVLDVEWNPKDGNLDRDLANFRSLYAVGQVDCGVIITREHVQLRALFRDIIQQAKDAADTIPHEEVRERVLKATKDPLATATTANFSKLVPKMKRDDGSGCPILAVAITERCYKPPEGDIAAEFEPVVGAFLEDAPVPVESEDPQ